jgi:hypothetical protein
MTTDSKVTLDLTFISPQILPLVENVFSNFSGKIVIKQYFYNQGVIPVMDTYF